MSSSLSSAGTMSPQSPTERTDCHTAVFTTRWLEPSLAVVCADGELDAANSQHFVDYAMRRAAKTPRLVLDTTEVKFFGTAGFSALHTFNVQCAGAGAEWVLVPSAAVTRLLRICDPDATFPVCENLDAALAEVQRGSHRLLQLVSKSS